MGVDGAFHHVNSAQSEYIPRKERLLFAISAMASLNALNLAHLMMR
jgi:hypothetical protein